MRTICLYALGLSMLVLSACQKDISTPITSATTVAQDKDFIKTTVNNVIPCVQALKDGNLGQAMIQFFGASNGTAANQTWIDEMTAALETSMGPLEIDQTLRRFIYSKYWGTYTWDRVNKRFNKTAANVITIVFPSTPAQTTNDVTVSLTQYTDAQYMANAEIIYLPKTVKGFLRKNNVDLITINGTADYSPGNFPSPTNVNIDILLAPFGFNFTVKQINSTQFTVTANLLTGGPGVGCGSNLTATVSFNSDDYDNFDAETFLKTVQAEYKKGDFRVVANWDAKSYYLLYNGSNTTAILNSTSSSALYHNTDKIGDLKFQDVAGVRKLFVTYKDGTTDNTAIYSDPFLTDLKNVLRSVFGNDVDDWF